MNKITSLTPEQAARFGEWAKKWIDIGLSTEPADFEAATEAALRGYGLANLSRPMVVLRVSSPYAATVGGAMAWLLLKGLGNKPSTQVRDQVWDQVRAQVWDQVRDQVGAQVRAQVRAQVWDQVGDQVWDQVGGAAKDGFDNDFGGSLWAQFAAWVSFFRDVCNWDGDALEKFEVNETLVKTCGWVWWHQNVLAISDRPNSLNRDEQGRLHCESGPSISYRDGWSMYHWHGVKVDAYVVENPEKITIGLIESEKNAEVRRVMIERYGQAKYLLDSGAVEIQRDDFGALFRKEIPGDEPLVMVKVVNSTPEPDGGFKDYFLRVPPSMKTAHEAVAWTFDKTVEAYQPALQT